MALARSPLYPQRSLGEAVKFIEDIYASEKTHPASEEALVQAIGYNTLNGKSRSALAALKRYGLLDKTQDGVHKLSQLSMKILFPLNPEDRKLAIRTAFTNPSVFLEMFKRFGQDLPSATTMRNYLMSIGFVDTGAQELVETYTESLDFLKAEGVEVSPPEGLEVEETREGKPLSNPIQLEAEEVVDENDKSGLAVRLAPETQTVVEDMVVKVSKNAHVHVRFAGEYSKRSIDVLIKYLEVMKLTFDLDDGDT